MSAHKLGLRVLTVQQYSKTKDVIYLPVLNEKNLLVHSYNGALPLPLYEIWEIACFGRYLL